MTFPPTRWCRSCGRVTAGGRIQPPQWFKIGALTAALQVWVPHVASVAAIPALERGSRDVVKTAIALNIRNNTGTASITVPGAPRPVPVVLAVDQLTVLSVSQDVHGTRISLPYAESEGELRIPLPAGPQSLTIEVQYEFMSHSDMQGWLGDHAVSFLWPDHCAKMFPCQPDPADGVRVTFDVTGVPKGQVAVTPPELPVDGPAYMAAVAVGPYRKRVLGRTRAGTQVAVWMLPGSEVASRRGTRSLVRVFDFLERTYGPYAFGSEVGSVAVRWPNHTSFAGMEHHPFWHVSETAMADAYIHAHEAAHGWFGNAVRIRCPEDFVLSEGLTTYASLRALEEAAGDDAWADYNSRVEGGCQRASIPAMPSTCGVVSLSHSPIASQETYVKGACFLHDVAMTVGARELDALLATFYLAHRGQAAEMEDLVEGLHTAFPQHKAAIEGLVDEWLRQATCPSNAVARCMQSLREH